ncbi:unnamed protein product [Brachionus calyciflorus]|uniref:Rhodanese domain-containing protein n=1 Tax=Brachionus calyciflorus TaxID=104777 RepID=A0A814BUS0_9BILA|nr:unnamed protein product [Brachionus calyciflorus]
MSEKKPKANISEGQGRRFNLAQLFSVGTIIFIAFLSATYIPQEYLNQVKSYFIQVGDKTPIKNQELMFEPRKLKDLLEKNDFDQNYRLIESFFSTQSKIEFENEHIPKAIYFDVLHGAESNKLIPKNIPSEKEFKQYVSSLGVSNNHHVIVYDRSEYGFFTSARAWYLFKLYGHDNVSILNGGFKAWIKENFQTSNEFFAPEKVEYKIKFNKDLIRNYENIEANLKNQNEILIDSRENDEFNAKDTQTKILEQIPNSINLPYSELFDKGKSALKDKSELIELFKKKKIDLNKPIIASCMYGVRSCSTLFAAYLLGANSVALYPV